MEKCQKGSYVSKFFQSVYDYFKSIFSPKMVAKTIKYAITGTLALIGLIIENPRGQGYDGAANMSRAYNGV